MKAKRQRKWPAGFLMALGFGAFCFVIAELIIANSVAQYPGVPPADIGSLPATTGLAIAACAIAVATLQLLMMWLHVSQLNNVANASQANTEILGAIQELTEELRRRQPIVHNHYQTSLFAFPESKTHVYGIDRRKHFESEADLVAPGVRVGEFP